MRGDRLRKLEEVLVEKGTEEFLYAVQQEILEVLEDAVVVLEQNNLLIPIRDPGTVNFRGTLVKAPDVLMAKFRRYVKKKQ